MKRRTEKRQVEEVKTFYGCEFCDYENDTSYSVACHERDSHSFIKQSGGFFFFKTEEQLDRYACGSDVEMTYWEGPGWYAIYTVGTGEYPRWMPLGIIKEEAEALLKACEKAEMETPDGL